MAVAQVVILNNGITSQEIKRGEINRATAKTGEHYRVLEKTVDKDQLLDDVLAKKEGQDLHLVYSDGTEVILEDYYTVCADGACDVTLPGDTASGYQISTNDVTGIAASEESSLVYAHGQRDTLISMTQDTPMQATLSDIEGAQITYLPEEATGLSMGAWGGLALLGGLGIAATNGSDVNNTVTGTIVGGPVLEGNDLKVIAYQADGVTVLGEGTVDTIGKFTIDVGSYTGVVIAKVINQGSGADYLDEATGVGKDLNFEIFSTGVVTSANSTLTLNLNAVTTIAYHKALESTAGAPLDETTVNSTNTAIAQAFGLSDLHTTDIITTNGTTSFDSSDGLNAGETYGTILAALSGADTNNEGNSQATIDNLVAGITIAGETATLTAAVQDEVIQGAGIVSANSGGETSVIVDTIAPAITSTATATVIDENSGASQVIYTTTATDSSTITYTLKTGSDAGLTINSTTGDVTLTAAPDVETTPSYNFTVVATDAANNASEQAVSLAINNLDEVAPAITSAATATAIDENSGAGQVIYTAASTDSADIANGSPVYSLKADSDGGLTINGSTGDVTLTADPNFEAKNSYSFTVVATDTANNASEQAVSLAINNLDESAPAITSAATATAIDENSGAGQVIYTATSTDSGDIANGSPVYSLKADSDGGLTINGTTGDVTLTADPNFEAKDSYSFTVVATDSANNASEQAVSLAINNLDEVAPAITSAATATAIDENSGAGQVIYTATSTDSADITNGNTVYSLKTGSDAGLTINGTTGEVTLTADPDFETKPSYSFIVVATDSANNASEQAVAITVTNVNDNTPVITSAATASFAENATGTVYTATATDADAGATLTYALGGTDALLFAIDDTTGAVTFNNSPDFEAAGDAGENNVYDITVTSSDGTNTSAAQAVAITVTNVNDNTPVITSAATASFAENATGTVYTATATDADAGATLTYALGGTDAALFAIDANGAVTFKSSPDFEAAGDDGTNNVYDITVTSSDGTNTSAAQAVAISVTDLVEGSSFTGNPAIVVFDLVNGVSSDHSNRTFDATLTYTIFVVVDATSHRLNEAALTGATWGKWEGADNLGWDDTIVLSSGDGAGVKGQGGEMVGLLGVGPHQLDWGVKYHSVAAVLNDSGNLHRLEGRDRDSVDLWDGEAEFGRSESQMRHEYNPAGLGDVLTTQGLT